MLGLGLADLVNLIVELVRLRMLTGFGFLTFRVPYAD